MDSRQFNWECEQQAALEAHRWHPTPLHWTFTANRYNVPTTTTNGGNMYEMAIAELENKAKRQRENLKATDEMIAGLKALRDRDQIPLITEKTNAAQTDEPPKRRP